MAKRTRKSTLIDPGGNHPSPVDGLPEIEAAFPRKLQCLFYPARYKVLHGGRASAKSWSVAQRYIMLSRSERDTLFLCARELQNSIADSVYALLANTTKRLGISDEFHFYRKNIVHKVTGSNFIFKGIRHNIEEIKSTEGVKYCWVEEGAKLSENSINVLFPTMRTDGWEITVTYNPEEEADAIHRMFVASAPPPESVVQKVTFRDNPWFDEAQNVQRLWLMGKDIDAYNWVWEGECRKVTENAIYNRVRFEPFDTPSTAPDGERIRFFYGLDWGFGSDPCAGVRCFVVDNTLYIDHEMYGFDISLTDLPNLIVGSLPGIAAYTSYGDNERPETIKYLAMKGIPGMKSCTKKRGSVEDGIAFVQSFDEIVVHPRCENTAREIKLYRYKKKKVSMETEELTFTEPEDRHNHTMDAIRYAFDAEINGRGEVAVSDAFLKNLEGYRGLRRGRYGRR